MPDALELMRRFTLQDSSGAAAADMAAAAGLFSAASGAEAAARVKTFLRGRVRYRKERGEVITPMGETLRAGEGDCDQQAVAAATMLEAARYRTRFRIVLQAAPDGRRTQHAYAQLQGRRGVWV